MSKNAPLNEHSLCPNYVGTHPHLGERCEGLGVVRVGGRKYCKCCEREIVRNLRRYAQPLEAVVVEVKS
jgi:hypothetical protein